MSSSTFARTLLVALTALYLSATVCPTLAAQRAGPAPSAPKIVTGSPAFTKQVIDTTVDETHDVAVGDFNGDDYPDAVATDFRNGEVIWYENDQTGGFIRRVLDNNLAGAYPVGVGDIDQDGNIDVIAGGYLANVLVWYESHGNGSFTRHDVGIAFGPHSIVAVDLDQDGDVDFVTSSQDSRRICWYENDGTQSFTEHIIDPSANAAKRAEAADMDGDGDIDVVSAIFLENSVRWYENDGNENFTTHVIDDLFSGCYYAHIDDLDGDNDQDVLAASQLLGSIAWYRNDGSGNFVKRVIDDNALGARTSISADVDGDGDPDVLSASVDDDTIAWYPNDGTGRFVKRTIDTAAGGAYGVTTGDMDRDGDTDVLGALRDDDTVALYSQIQHHVVAITLGGMTVIDRSALETIDADDPPTELIYTLTAAPGLGALRLDGVALSAGSTFTQDDVDNGRLSYRRAGTSTNRDSFAFTVQDGGEAGNLPLVGDVEVVVAGVGDSVVHLRLEEGSGNVAIDSSGNGNHGTLVNGPSFDTSTSDGSTFSLRLNGTDQYVDLGTLDPGGLGLTLAAWLNADTFGTGARDPRVISKAVTPRADEHVFMLSTIAVFSETHLRGRVRINNRATTLIASSGALQTQTWHHAALTHDGITMRLFLDGAEVGSTPLAGTVDVDPSMPVTVGAQPPGAGARFFPGLLDDVRILRRALAPSEVALLARSCNGRFRRYGVGLAGSGGIVPQLGASGCPILDELVTVQLSGSVGGTLGLLLFGSQTSFPVLGGTLLVVPVIQLPIGIAGAGPGNGTASFNLRIPAAPSAVGASFFWQTVVVDSSATFGFSFTPGLEMAVGQ